MALPIAGLKAIGSGVLRLRQNDEWIQIYPLPNIEIVNIAKSDFSRVNRNPHPYTYSLVSPSQDGTTALLVLFLGDDGDISVTPNKGTVVVQSSHNDGGRLWAGYYVPDSGEFSAGEVAFNFATGNSQLFQYLIYELRNVNLAAIAADSAYDGSNASRQTAGPMSVTAPAGGLIVSAAAMAGTDWEATLSIQTANGFTFTDENVAANSADANWIAAHRIVSAADDYDSPVFHQSDSADEINALTIVIAPAA